MAKTSRFIFFLLAVNACTQSPKRPFTEVQSTGQYKDGLEVGLWFYKGSDSSVVEEGRFDKGIRVGLWKYYLPKKDSINWNKFSNISGSILTNIPSFFELRDNYDSLVYFEYPDTSRIFRLVIGADKCSDIFTLDQYQEQLYIDIKNKKFQILDTITQEIKTAPGDQYLYCMTSKQSGLFAREYFLCLN